jgi:hypothetical protein
MREQHRYPLLLSAIVAVFVSLSSVALVTGCGDKNKADSKGAEAHEHKEGDGHDHKEGDGHKH